MAYTEKNIHFRKLMREAMKIADDNAMIASNFDIDQRDDYDAKWYLSLIINAIREEADEADKFKEQYFEERAKTEYKGRTEKAMFLRGRLVSALECIGVWASKLSEYVSYNDYLGSLGLNDPEPPQENDNDDKIISEKTIAVVNLKEVYKKQNEKSHTK